MLLQVKFEVNQNIVILTKYLKENHFQQLLYKGKWGTIGLGAQSSF